MTRVRPFVRSTGLVLAFATGFAPTLDLAAETPLRDARQTYILRVTRDGRGETSFSGWLSVNGQRQALLEFQTPFEFRCEAGEVIEGVVQAAPPGKLRVQIVDYGYSPRKPAVQVWEADGASFAWALPGAGPRRLEILTSCPGSPSSP